MLQNLQKHYEVTLTCGGQKEKQTRWLCTSLESINGLPMITCGWNIEKRIWPLLHEGQKPVQGSAFTSNAQ